MMLPFCSQSFLKEFWVFKALAILKFINADNKVQLFLFCNQLRQVKYFLIIFFQFLPLKTDVKILHGIGT